MSVPPTPCAPPGREGPPVAPSARSPTKLGVSQASRTRASWGQVGTEGADLRDGGHLEVAAGALGTEGAHEAGHRQVGSALVKFSAGAALGDLVDVVVVSGPPGLGDGLQVSDAALA